MEMAGESLNCPACKVTIAVPESRKSVSQSSDAVFCAHCRIKIVRGARFCAGCGHSVEPNKTEVPRGVNAANYSDQLDSSAPSPALWNPNAITNWSVLFSPVFGSILLSRNWKALGEPVKAKNAIAWAWISVLFWIIPFYGTSYFAGNFGWMWLAAWYFAVAKEQSRKVKELFGKKYPRKSWGIPLGIAFPLVCLSVLIVGFEPFTKARAQAQQNACINNLLQIEAGKEQWALETKHETGEVADMVQVMQYLRNPSSSTNCPAGGAIDYGVIGTNATCTVPGHVLNM